MIFGIEWCFMVGWVGFEIYGVQWKMTVKKSGDIIRTENDGEKVWWYGDTVKKYGEWKMTVKK